MQLRNVPIVVFALTLGGCATSAASIDVFETYAERKFSNVLQQQKDFSCGAASIATLLTFGHGKPVSEEDVLSWAEDRLDLDEVSRRGLNLLQMSEFLEEIGLRAVGARIDFETLKRLPGPVIVHISILGYTHFAVLRGFASGRLYVADSNFGNMSIRETDFLRMWIRKDTNNGTILAVQSDQAYADSLSIKGNQDLSRLYDYAYEVFNLRNQGRRETR